jgi:hypothetical protein
LAKIARQKWNMWAFGHETPTLKNNQAVPALPGDLPERSSDIIPVQGAMPPEIAPRR